MGMKTPLKNRSERSGNLVSIAPYDITSNAYKKDSKQSPQTGFGAYITVAILVFLVVFFVGCSDNKIQQQEDYIFGTIIGIKIYNETKIIRHDLKNILYSIYLQIWKKIK